MRVVLAMSGGVDSSAAAHLLQRQGHEVIGLFMRSGMTEETYCATSPDEPAADEPAAGKHAAQLPVVNPQSNKQGCCSASDAADARRVADLLDIPFHALNFRDAFGQIMDYFADEYLTGRTPNPCVMCNNWLKFGKLWDFAEQVGAQRIATGHYAQLIPDPATGEIALTRGRDRAKDQSYVLFGINKHLLDKIIFPVGDFDKTAIRALAAEAGLNVADKADSQEICFIPDQDYVGFIERHRGIQETAGELVDTAGNVVGHHQGYQNFTIGQRKGLGVTFGEPRFVTRIEPESRRVVVGAKADLERKELTADRLNWLVDDLPAAFRCRAQIRYRHAGAAAEVTVTADDHAFVQFEQAQLGVAPGQAVVFYDNLRVLGGGWICN